MDDERLFLLDGTALAYRAHFAFIKQPLVNRRGLTTSAIFGFVRDLKALMTRERPAYLAVAFDTPEPTFRHRAYAEYKATREKMPPELAAQLPYLERVVRALGVAFIKLPGYEADDIVGTLTARARERGLEVFLVTPDKDYMQLVGETVRLYRFQGGSEPEVFGPAQVREKLGVDPGRVRDLLGLMGDSSDNIPGVPGVGPKTAAKLLAEHGDLEGVLAAAPALKAGKLRQSLIEHADTARLSRQLATIDCAVPLELELEALRPAAPDLATLRPLLEELEFESLLREFRAPAAADAVEHRYRIIGDDQTLAEALAELNGAAELAVDTETTSLDPLEAELVGVSLCARPGQAWYLPVMGNGGRERLARLAPLLADPARPKGGHHIKYDLRVLRRAGLKLEGLSFDSMIFSHLADPSGRHSLDHLSLKVFQYVKIPTEQLIGKGKAQITMDQVPVAQVGEYACEDADYTLRLHRHFAPEVERLGLTDWAHEVEMPLLRVLADMEDRGIRVDREALAAQGRELEERLGQLEAEIHALAGEVFNIRSPQQLAPILYEKLALHERAGRKRPPRTAGGAWSTDEAFLEELRPHHPIVPKLLSYRELSKLLGTYVRALPGMVSPDTGRIHTSFHQTGTETGRLSSSDPNLQNIPVRTAEGRRVRQAFVPGAEGWLLCSADYSQVELRILAHLTGDAELVRVFREGGDIHARTAARIFKRPEAQIDSATRARAKAINFGVLYGMGPQRLARETGLTVPEAQAFIDDYFRAFPSVRGFIDGCIDEARRTGRVRTIAGRPRPLREIDSINRGRQVGAENAAVNSPIQGSAADIIKVAMVRIHERLAAEGLRAALLLQVHDELLFECPTAERGALEDMVRREMEGAWELAVPLKVDIGWGANWLEAH